MNNKICLITVRNLYAISCLPRYRRLSKNNIFDIVYWDRLGIDESYEADAIYAFKYTSGNNKIKRIIGYIKFTLFACNILKKKHYDRIILLPTQAGILLYPFIKKRFKNKYIIDIRDYTAEKNKIFYNFEKKLIRDSGLAIITSPAYERFLPIHNYTISHNTTYIPKDVIDKYRNRSKINKDKIIISCIGAIRFINQFIKVIDYFKNDNRFILRFIGNGSETLKDYCALNKITNVEVIGRFEPNETLSFYMATDIIMNLYGNKNPFLDYALSNKLYYAATLGIPILVCPDTYMEEISVKHNFGFTFDLNRKNMCSKLYNYYKSMNWDLFYQNCDDFMNIIHKENEVFENEVRNFINTNG